jgi:hypothetical protein
MPSFTRTPQRLKSLESRVAFVVDGGLVTSKANALIADFEARFNVGAMTPRQHRRFERFVTGRIALECFRNGTLSRRAARDTFRFARIGKDASSAERMEQLAEEIRRVIEAEKQERKRKGNRK